jgi:hypothetical protein
MLKLLERTIESAGHRLVVLAPRNASYTAATELATIDPFRHEELLSELQRLRGTIYTRDGAIRRDMLTADGRHETPDDERSWHLVLLNDQQHVSGCIWYLEHEGRPTLDRLRAGRTPLARDAQWRGPLKAAIDTETARAFREGIAYAEVGGWAVADDSHMADCLMLVLGTYCLSQLNGGALVIATATARHSSARILRRMGGSPLVGLGTEIPGYYDPAYTCDMELLRFDTRVPGAHFASLVRGMKRQFAQIPVVAAEPVMVPAMFGKPLSAQTAA